MKYIGILLFFITLTLNAADQSPWAMNVALKTCIKDGNYEFFLQHRERLAECDCVTLMHCLEAHRSALEAENNVLNDNVNEQLVAICETINERFNAQVTQYMQEHAHQEYPVHKVDYDVVANTFVYEELMNRAPWWCFWQRDYNRECALKVFSDLRNLSVGMSANNIRKRTEGLSKEDKEAYIEREQQETEYALMIVQKTIDTHWKKVYARRESDNEIENFHYERKKPGEEAEWQCVIL